VEVNGEIVPQRSFDERRLFVDDRIEVVSLVGGG
jgi:thiamine biosynthesis protein ThiS